MEKKTNKMPSGLFAAHSTQIICSNVKYGLFLYYLKRDGKLFPKGADVGTVMKDDILSPLPGMVHLPSLMLSRGWGL